MHIQPLPKEKAVAASPIGFMVPAGGGGGGAARPRPPARAPPPPPRPCRSLALIKLHTHSLQGMD